MTTLLHNLVSTSSMSKFYTIFLNSWSPKSIIVCGMFNAIHTLKEKIMVCFNIKVLKYTSIVANMDSVVSEDIIVIECNIACFLFLYWTQVCYHEEWTRYDTILLVLPILYYWWCCTLVNVVYTRKKVQAINTVFFTYIQRKIKKNAKSDTYSMIFVINHYNITMTLYFSSINPTTFCNVFS